jgi:hypothetical protein
MKKLASLALAFCLSPAFADTISASLSNLTLTGATWGDLTGSIGATSSAPGQEAASEVVMLSGIEGRHSVAAGGVSAFKNADGTRFLVTADETVTGTGYWGGINLRSDHSGQLAAIAPGATVSLSADIAGSAHKSGLCETNDCGSFAFGSLTLDVGLTSNPYPGQVIQHLHDGDILFTFTDDSFERRLQVSYTNTTGVWQYAAITVELGLDGIVAAPIPEPSTYALLALGLGAIALRGARQSPRHSS